MPNLQGRALLKGQDTIGRAKEELTLRPSLTLPKFVKFLDQGRDIFGRAYGILNILGSPQAENFRNYWRQKTYFYLKILLSKFSLALVSGGIMTNFGSTVTWSSPLIQMKTHRSQYFAHRASSDEEIYWTLHSLHNTCHLGIMKMLILIWPTINL